MLESTPLVALPLLPTSVGNAILLLGSFGLLLLGAEIFTNGVEWLGIKLGVSESATGSILAAVGTALPETMIPIIAIVSARYGSGTQAAANEVGVGAILGAPFMLATIAMFLVGSSVIYFSDRRVYGREFHFNATSTKRDLSFFLVGYTLAFVAALVHSSLIAHLIGATLIMLYVVYVYRSLKSGELAEDEDLDDLKLGNVVDRLTGNGSHAADGGSTAGHSANPSQGLVVLQTLFALALIVVGAQLFVEEVSWAADAVGIPAAVVALLIAPLATELPEKFNSVIWITRDKDTLAIGNITGAMAFQGTLPVTLGIVFTDWNLSLPTSVAGLTHPSDPAGLLNGISAVLAIVSGAILYLRARKVDTGNMHPRPFLVGGLFYLVFVALLVFFVLSGQIHGTVAGH